MNNINWIPVEGYHHTKFLAADSIATLTAELNGESRDEKFNHSVKAYVPGACPYKLFTGTKEECYSFLNALLERTGKIADIARDLRSLNEMCKK